jgi:uncharacterized protein with FMN-binding domain
MSEKKISRREFLKGGAALAASTAILGLAGCAKETPAAPAAEPAAEKGIYTPGTYSASATGMGVVVVKATFDANAITNIELDVSNETEAIGQAAKDELIKQAMAAQSAEIDGVSGATITSNAVKTALKNCIAQAKGEPVDSGSVAKAEVASEGAFVLTDITAEDVNASAVILDPITDFAETVDVDIVVAGAGAAGVIAAVRAAELGAKVAMLQKESVAVSQGNCLRHHQERLHRGRPEEVADLCHRRQLLAQQPQAARGVHRPLRRSAQIRLRKGRHHRGDRVEEREDRRREVSGHLRHLHRRVARRHPVL